MHVLVQDIIDRTSLAEKSARKDEKTLFWRPPISLVWLPNQWETKQRKNKLETHPLMGIGAFRLYTN